MIQANEIRIGNLVTAGKIIVKIESIWNNSELSYREDGSSYREMHFVVSGFVKSWYKFYPNDLTPIPLSPDILEKAGFVKSANQNRNVWYKEFKREHDSLSSYLFVGRVMGDPDGMFYYGYESPLSSVNINNIYYLHTLQNGYHFLTNGQELTINL